MAYACLKALVSPTLFLACLALSVMPWSWSRGEYGLACLDAGGKISGIFNVGAIFVAAAAVALMLPKAKTGYVFEVIICVLLQALGISQFLVVLSLRCMYGPRHSHDQIPFVTLVMSNAGFNEVAVGFMDLVLVQRASALASEMGWEIWPQGLWRTWRLEIIFIAGVLAVNYLSIVAGAQGWMPQHAGFFLRSVPRTVLMFMHSVFGLANVPLFLAPLRLLWAATSSQWVLQERKEEVKHLCRIARNQLWVVLVNSLASMVMALFYFIMLFLEGSLSDTLVTVLDMLCTANYLAMIVSALVLSEVSFFSGLPVLQTGSCRLEAKAESMRRMKATQHASDCKTCTNEKWQEVVGNLAMRGVSLVRLLEFYKCLPEVMPHFDASVHRTLDVVREAIIPSTADERCACAVKMMDGKPTRPQVMVTHNWGNLFRDLVAAIIADSLGEPDFGAVAYLMDTDMVQLEKMLTAEALMSTYWICALSVNQHISVCSQNLNSSSDPVTAKQHPLCTCGCTRQLNTTAPLRDDGKGILCEMNKFDDMMSFLASSDTQFAQLVVVDRRFQLFSRAWCVAEVVEAEKMGMQQRVKLPSKASAHANKCHLERLKVEEMQAARPEDVVEILSKIACKESFNSHVQELLFGEAGLMMRLEHQDAMQQAASVGRLARLYALLAKRYESGPMSDLLDPVVKTSIHSL